MSQNNFSKNVNIFLGVILVLFGGFVTVRSYMISAGSSSKKEIASHSADIDSSLIDLINDMENKIDSKRDFVFYVNPDPLKLTRVIVDTSEVREAGKFQEKEEELMMRLTATIIMKNSGPKAVIKYRNKSSVVQIGDTLGEKYRIVDIGPKTVLINDGTKNFVLKTVPATPEGETPPAVSPEKLTANNSEVPNEY